MFQQSQLHNIVADRSDHYPILLKLHGDNMRTTTRDFKFENVWLLEEELEGLVLGGWAKEYSQDL
ncbi:hypothetical protein A2U01_0072994, partial [Trifolium medium]|nr:hypothetical protein [Trifolium medium]